MVTIDLAKAKEIKKQSLRQQRQPLLEEQDVLFMRAQEAGADTTAIIAEKVRLRDITKLCDTATSVAELKAISIETD
jgi:hypothetical protein|tara:strand:- start:208 stop:438 length:231 start_codon:yes stop_codon:yes gene_type:complete